MGALRMRQQRGRGDRTRLGLTLTSPRPVLCSAPSGVYILIGAGALMMVVGFLGCCGAVQESQCMLGLVSVPSVPTTPGPSRSPTQELMERGMGWSEAGPWGSSRALSPPHPTQPPTPPLVTSLPSWSLCLITSFRRLSARTLLSPFSRTTFAFFL